MEAPRIAAQLTSIHREVRNAVIQTTPLLTEQFACERQRIRLGDEPIFNPSVAQLNGRQVFVSRRSTGMSQLERRFGYENDAPHDTVNHLHVYDGEDRLLGHAVVDDSMTRALSGIADLGLEDIRLLRFRGGLYGLCSGVSRRGNGLQSTQILVRFSRHRVVGYRIFRSPTHAFQEKNWSPLVIDDRLFLLYCLDPVVCFEVLADGLTLRKGVVPKRNDFRLRGGTPFVGINGKFVAVAHHAPIHTDRNHYRHCFVVFDRNFNFLESSAPFFIQRRGIEFAAGLSLSNDHLTLSYGVADRAAFYTRFHVRELDRLLVSV